MSKEFILIRPDNGTEHVWANDVSDTYHTMDELYEHRNRLWIALCKIYDNYVTPLGCNIQCWKSKIHNNGIKYEGWFILGMSVHEPSFYVDQPKKDYQLSYHLPEKYWHLAKVLEMPKAPKFDGHTSNDVLERLLRL